MDRGREARATGGPGTGDRGAASIQAALVVVPALFAVLFLALQFTFAWMASAAVQVAAENAADAASARDAGEADAPWCETCHGEIHSLVPSSAKDSPVHPSNLPETCGSCHNEPAEAGTPKCSEMSMSKNPYHIGCIGCHKDTKKADAESKVPVKCAECHPKG